MPRWMVVFAVLASCSVISFRAHACGFDCDGLVTVSAAVRTHGFRFAAGGGGLLGGTGELERVPLMQASAYWGFAPGLAVDAVTSWTEGGLSPSVGFRFQLLNEPKHGANVTGVLRYRAIGYEGVGQQVDLRLAVGRGFGPIAITTNAMLGQSFAGRDDIDFEGALSLAWTPHATVRPGIEARVHFEVADRLHTIEDTGRPYGLVLGPTLSMLLPRTTVQVLGGMTLPRGPYQASPVLLGTVTIQL